MLESIVARARRWLADRILQYLTQPLGRYEQRARNDVRARMKSDVEVGADASYLALRENLAVAIDDEESYAYLHAYTAYRNGFKAAHVGSDDLATYILGNSAPLGTPDLSFEDLFITFPDGSHGYSWLRHRDEILPLLARTPQRIFVTSGQSGWYAPSP